MQQNGGGVGAHPGWLRSAWDWLWRGQALASARADLVRAHHAGEPEPAYTRRAEVALELADRALDPIDPLRAGSSLPLSLSLYRQAGYWALCALGVQSSQSGSFAQLFDAAPPELLLSAAGSPTELAGVRTAFVERSFVDDARQEAPDLEPQARALRAFVAALLLRAEPARVVERLLWQRRVRMGAMLLIMAGAALGVALAAAQRLQAPDLARGRPWRASSTGFQCHPERAECGGATTKIFFHTTEERNPWIELDLGAPQRIATIEVDNRRDCCGERAVPLAIEVSSDRIRFREVARRIDPFVSWRVRIEPVTARYVRARVTRRSLLHLERLSVYAR